MTKLPLRFGVLARCACALIVGTLCPRLVCADATIRLVPDNRPHVEVVGLPRNVLTALSDAKLDAAAWQKVLSLHVLSNGERPTLPVLGDYSVSDSRLVFKPRFPLKPGLKYKAIFNPAPLRHAGASRLHPVEAIVSLPAAPRGKSAAVTAIYPSGDVIPENQLKFYIRFSAPMSRGDSYRHIRLLDADGMRVEAPFLELAEELWDESGTRLTLLLDPGRVKQDLKPNKEVGRALVAGNIYTLYIDNEWRDANGNPLAAEFRKTFRAGDSDTVQPDPRRWRVAPPRAGARTPFVIDFNEPLDHALLEHSIRVVDTQGRNLDGRIDIDKNETRWAFEPTTPWSAGGYRLVIDPTLEDLAGNSIERPFEVFILNAGSTQKTQPVLEFEVR